MIAAVAMAVSACGQSIRWVKEAGGVDDDYGAALTLDAAGNIYATGFFVGSSKFGNSTLTGQGGQDIVLLKMDRNGNFLWAKQAGGSGSDQGLAIAVDQMGQIYLAGFFEGTARFDNLSVTSRGGADAFVAKFNDTGKVLWAAQAGGTAKDFGSGIAVDTAGNCYVTGSYQGVVAFAGTTLTGDGSTQCFLAKYDPSGNVSWVRNTSGETALGNGVAADADGRVWVVGDYYPGAPQDLHNTDFFVAHYDALGKQAWRRNFGGSEVDSGHAIAADAAGSCYVSGHFSGAVDFGGTRRQSHGNWDIFALKCDPNGEVVWTWQAGGSQIDEGRGIALDRDGNCFVTGYFITAADFGNTHFTSSGNSDAFVAKLDGQGRQLWAVQSAATAYVNVHGLAVDESGGSFATGYFRSATLFGGFSLSNHGAGRDMFVTRIDGPPAPPRLSIERMGSQLTLSWPTIPAGFRLESTTNLTSAGNWSAVTNLAVSLGNQRSLTNVLSEPGRFYRLRRP